MSDIGARANLSNPADTTYFQADKIHLTAAGYLEMATGIAATLATL